MKHLQLFFVACFVMLVSFASCTKDDSNPSANDVSNLVQQGKWKITSFTEDTNDETFHFTGYEFVFTANGSVSATKENTSVNGTWATGTDNSRAKLILSFGTTSPFDELNEDWRVLEKTSTSLKLEHVSGGNGGTDHLEFQKI